MGIIPDGRTERINFFENRLTIWAQNAAAIGIDPTQATQIAGLTVQARTLFNAAQVARDNAKSATQAQNEAIDAMAAYGSDLIKTIKAYAETESDPGVYNTANLPLPKPRTPLGPAPTPENVTLRLTRAGTIAVGWDADTRGRMAFVVERRTRMPGELPTAWSIAGTTTTKSFIDETLPTGLESVEYRVLAERPGGRSEPTDPVTALFGTGGQTAGEADLRIAA